MRRPFTVLFTMLVTFLVASGPALAAPPIADNAFRHVWERQDLPVVEYGAQAGRSWTWGPAPISGGLQEKMIDSMQHTRLVQYFDKSRMEINDPNADWMSEWYVTNGLLPIELMTGDIQVGYNQTEHKGPARITAVGDPGQFPTYTDLLPFYLSHGPIDLNDMGRPVTKMLNSDSTIGTFSDNVSDPATFLVEHESDHPIVKAFWDYQHQWGKVYENGYTDGYVYNPLYVFGMPITDAFWVKVKVGEHDRMVLFQVFERRVMTYNPANQIPWRVEMGNVGQHYYQWRYPQAVVR